MSDNAREAAPAPMSLEEQIRQESYRANEYRKAWHKAEEERDAAFDAGVVEGIRMALANLSEAERLMERLTT